jgi:DNA-binding transcriptional regulator YiaG
MSRQVNTTSSSQAPPLFRPDRLDEALRGTTSEAFAREINRTLRTVQRWRGGESAPSGADLIVIARALGREPSWFYQEAATA